MFKTKGNAHRIPLLLEARDRLLDMYRSGQIDATTALQMMAEMRDAAPASESKQACPNPKKRVAPTPVPDEADHDSADDADIDEAVEGAIMESLTSFENNMNPLTSYPMVWMYKLMTCVVSLFQVKHFVHQFVFEYRLSKDQKTKAALKARLRRLCELKKNGKLNVPEWLHKKWKEDSGKHLDMAMEFQKANFNKDRVNVHSKLQWIFHLFNCLGCLSPSNSSCGLLVSRISSSSR